jgi:phosphate-selective porin
LANLIPGDENMRSLTFFVLALVFLVVPGSVHAQDTDADKQAKPATAAANEQEVQQLRSELEAQRQTIEELKAMVQRLADAGRQPSDGARVVPANSPEDGNAHLTNAVLMEPPVVPPVLALADQQPAAKKEPTPTAGWNTEHFFIKSSDGTFQLLPYGYFQTDYRGYRGDGAPANTFVVRRARFGFQGNYGKYYDFAVLLDSAAGNGISLRDLYVNVKPIPQFQVQVGQYKEPFAQEELTAVTNIDFVERSLASLLYPAASTAFRSPGITIHGDFSGGVMQYWLGAFNGKGILAADTTNEPEILGRLRFYPWRKKKDNLFQGLSFGASIGRGRTRGLSNEQSFNATLPDNVYTFFPSFVVNGKVERYNGEATWVHGPWGIRAEYDQLLQFRTGVGSEQPGGLGFTTLPGIVAKAGYGQVTYLLTGETRPENGTPRVKHPYLGPSTDAKGGTHGMGAWELAFRYDRIQAKEPGINQLNISPTPGFVPTFSQHTDQFTGGLNWYLNYWVKYQFNLSIDRLSSPSTIGQEPQNFFVLLNRLQFRF